LEHCDYWTLIGGKRYLQVQDVDKSYFAEVTEVALSATETAELLSKMDKDGDGKLSLEELKAGEKELETTGFTLLKKNPSRESDKSRSRHGSTDGNDHHAKLDTQIGPQEGVLDGRVEF